MLTTKELMAQATSLPVDERASLADSLLRSLNPPNDEIDRKWAGVAKRRLKEVRSGQVEAVPADEVFARVWTRLSQ